MTLTRLAEQLSNVRGTYLVGLTALHVLCDPGAVSKARNERATFGGKQVRFAPVVALLLDKTDGDATRKAFGLSLIREVVIGVRAVVTRALAEELELDLEGVAWWSVARLIGAVLWSGGVLVEGQEEVRLMPFDWRGRRYEREGVLGSEMKQSWFGYADAFHLAEEATLHVERMAIAERTASVGQIDFGKLIRGE